MAWNQLLTHWHVQRYTNFTVCMYACMWLRCQKLEHKVPNWQMCGNYGEIVLYLMICLTSFCASHDSSIQLCEKRQLCMRLCNIAVTFGGEPYPRILVAKILWAMCMTPAKFKINKLQKHFSRMRDYPCWTPPEKIYHQKAFQAMEMTPASF
jgi:hypothetical protein